MNFSDKLSENSIFRIVGEAASQLHIEAYVVGGYVRDLLLNRPSKDVDFVCVGSGIDLAHRVAKMIDENIEVHFFKNFGTAMFKLNGFEYEFVGARKESYRKESRKPIVEDGTLEDDQNRRDFTINALALSLNKYDFGTLLDPFGGQKDLKSKEIKTPLSPEVTFSDDPLRMMRAIRFASQLQFDIEADTFEGIQKQAYRIEIVSKERIMTELNKIILSPKPSYGFNLLYHASLLEIIFPEFIALKGVETQEGKSHKDNFYHTLEVLDNISAATDNLWLRWAAILHDIAKPATKRFDKKTGWTFHGHEDKGARMVPRIFKRMKLPLNHQMKYVQKLVRLHLRPISLVKKEITDSAIRRLIYEAGDDIDDLMTLCRADITSKNHDRVKRYLQNFDRVEQNIKRVEESDRIRNLQPVVTGEVIMKTFDLAPCKEIGLIKDEIKEAILDGKIKNEFDQAYGFMLKQGEKMGLRQKESVAEPKPVKKLQQKADTKNL